MFDTQEQEQEKVKQRNIIDGILDECNRCRELLTHYTEIGPVGIFGKYIIEAAIREGEKAISSGDVLRMIAAFKVLNDCQ